MSDVRNQSKAVETMAANWLLIDALLGGTAAMRAAGKAYLPQWPNESDDSYKSRLQVATLFPAFSRTVEVLNGKPFSRQITLDKDVPTKIVDYCQNIDLEGRNLHSFLSGICQSALSYGLAGILVDYPQATGLRTAADEKAAGMRPYFVPIYAKSLLGWKVKRINGVQTLIQLRFIETAVEDSGEFAETEIEQVRVLYPDRWEIWRESDETDAAGKKVWKLFADGPCSLNKIPFVPVYGSRKAFMQAVPPLLELAHLNVEHWQSKSDQQTILHVARVPILFAKMFGDAAITVGASSAVKSEDPNADLRFVEHGGQAIEAGRKELLDLEDRMRQIGAELLVIKPGNTTVAQTLADNEPGMCALQRIVQDLEDAADQALQFMAEWIGEKEGGHVQIYNDFGVSTLGEASAELLREMNVSGTLSDESLFDEMQRRGLIRPDITWAQEQERISKQPPKEKQPSQAD